MFKFSIVHICFAVLGRKPKQLQGTRLTWKCPS